MRPKRSMQTRPSPFVAFLLALVGMAGLLAVFDRTTPGGPLPTSTLPPPPKSHTPSPVVVEPNRRQSVVLVSLGGASADALIGWMADGVMPTLSRLAEQGWMTTAFPSTDPPLPAPALTALATGAISPDAVPIWQTAAQHHRATALLFWPGADPAVPDQRADYTFTCARSPVAARQQTVLLSPVDAPWTGAPASFNPPYEGTITLPSLAGTALWRILALDTLDDNQGIYNTFFLLEGRGQQTLDENAPQLALDGWQTLPVFGQAAPGLMLTVTGLRTLTDTVPLTSTIDITPTEIITPTATVTPTVAPPPLLELRLYQIAALPVMTQPAALGRDVIERFGFCPPLPDPRVVATGRLSPAAFRELASLRARWAMQVTAYVHKTYRPHLLLARTQALLASEQALLLTDPRQPGYSLAGAAEFADHRRAVATAVDDGLDDLLAAVDLNYSTVAIVSEHGVAPVHTEINVTSALQSVWRRSAGQSSERLPGDAPPRLYAEGAFLSVDVGRGKGTQSAALSDETLRALATLTDPRTGDLIFDRVARREDAGSWAETWPYPGDVLAQAAPGYALAAAPGATKGLSATSVYGQAGYGVRLPAMQGALIVAGRGLSTGQEPSITRLLDISSLVEDWLGIDH